MKLHRLRISNFQSFGPKQGTSRWTISTFLIGPNGSGKTAVLQALCKLFAFDPNLRRLQRSDFHIPSGETLEAPAERTLWLEADFVFPELKDDAQGQHSTIPPHFRHMRLDDAAGLPRVRIRLDATLILTGRLRPI